ncbi:Z1 domain-containing protein [Corynebacterium segmentosum]|uniref:Restriction system endonuclease n=1 Tax=Corynebacterium segmentosum TaxID=43990 RepID=A0ABY6TCS5_9CORY|nr:Z1 domain-containing protein [Corynebacterium segmentosum]VEH72649.1 restriction system endonuclease [Corynebacterium segmentosum]
MSEGILNEESIEFFLEEFANTSRLGQDLDYKKSKMLRFSPTQEAEIEEAYTRHKRQIGHVVDRGMAAYKREKRGENWYIPNLNRDIYWPPLRASIEEDLGPAIEQIDRSSTAVMNGLRPTTAAKNQKSKGLVLGYVQSGKTTNFMSVIAKAADSGYRLIIVLTGITENLRRQTQKRIDEQLISLHRSRWTRLTDEESDFSGDRNSARIEDDRARFIAVVKKNGPRLRRLNQWLSAAGARADKCPILIIDDESDQASIDVSPQTRAERSAINQQISNLLEYEMASYIAYSATPFANILIDPSKETDLYPSDFIISLPEPEGYFGSRSLFGREPIGSESLEELDNDGYDMIRTISDAEVEGIRLNKKQKENQSIIGGPALTEAIRWFILATAARWSRGQQDKHSSMLIHTSMLRNDHDDLEILVKAELDTLRQQFAQGESETSNWRTQWEEEAERVPAADFGLQPVSFEELEVHLQEILDTTSIAVDNGTSDSRLDYDNSTQTVIAIGGNTLSRGLTLEGLVSSYFVRRASAYDTLLQMGRWFGFRSGYQDLPRIWMPGELRNWFHDLATVEAELREELDVYIQEETSPMEVQARIRMHPDMVITSKAKMQDAVQRQMSFSGKKEQTIKFKETDTEWLQNNLSATKDLFKSIQKRGIDQETGLFNFPVFRDVPYVEILDFLEKYEIHGDTRLGKEDAKLLIDYIRQESVERRIKKWNVSVVTQAKPQFGTIDLGFGDVNLISRSPLANSPKGSANIKTLVTTTDRVNDVIRNSDEERLEFRKQLAESFEGGHKEAKLRKAHDSYAGTGVGHLAIYPISKDSVPRSGTTENPRKVHRKPLEAEENIIGIGIFFPTSTAHDSNVDYMSAPEADDEIMEVYKQADEEIRMLNELDEAQASAEEEHAKH